MAAESKDITCRKMGERGRAENGEKKKSKEEK